MDWKNRLDQIKNKMKSQFNARGIDNILQVQSIFEVSILNVLIQYQEFDKNKSGTLDKLEFEEMMSKIGVFLARQELTTVYNHFDVNKDGQIQYDEFINTLRVSSFSW